MVYEYFVPGDLGCSQRRSQGHNRLELPPLAGGSLELRPLPFGVAEIAALRRSTVMSRANRSKGLLALIQQTLQAR